MDRLPLALLCAFPRCLPILPFCGCRVAPRKAKRTVEMTRYSENRTPREKCDTLEVSL